MTSIDQAFVKAYARRNQPDRAPQDSGTTADDGSLHINQSAAQTAAVWVDAPDDGGGARLRHDPADATPPTPHAVFPPQTGSPSVERRSPVSAPHEPLREARGPLREELPTAAPGDEPSPSAVAVPDAAPRAPQSSEVTFYAHATLSPELADLYTEPAPSPAPGRPEPAPSQFAEPAPSELSEPAPSELAEPAASELAHRQLAREGQREGWAAADDPAPHEAPASESIRTEAPLPDARAASSPTTSQRRAFRAVWEVDHFETPEAVACLFLNSALFEQIGNQMADAVRNGLGSILITSTKAGEGRSTAAVGTAMAAASAGLRVALVDADAKQPTLADDLRLDLEYGWLDALRGNLPIDEVSVHGLEEHLTLVPLMPPPGETAATAGETDDLVRQLGKDFDLVILDGAPAAESFIGQAFTAIDTALIVRDVTRTSTHEVHEISTRLRECGVQGIGVIENFS